MVQDRAIVTTADQCKVVWSTDRVSVRQMLRFASS